MARGEHRGLLQRDIDALRHALARYCTDGSCPTMCAGPKYEYRWADGVKVKKPNRVHRAAACGLPALVGEVAGG